MITVLDKMNQAIKKIPIQMESNRDAYCSFMYKMSVQFSVVVMMNNDTIEFGRLYMIQGFSSISDSGTTPSNNLDMMILTRYNRRAPKRINSANGLVFLKANSHAFLTGFTETTTL